MRAAAKWIATFAVALGAAVGAAVGIAFVGGPTAAPAPDAIPVRAAHAPPSFVPSMAGTLPDGRLRATAQDKLLLDAELRHLFDYYLSALGEASLPSVRAAIEHELSRRLGPAAAAQARRLLAQYLAYKRALADVDGKLAQHTPGSPAAAARTRLHAMQATRSSYFTAAEAQALFADLDARDSDAIARLELAENQALTPVERAQRLAALDSRLPPALRAEREAPRRILSLETQVQAARAQGAGDDEVYRLRAAAFDPQAAARLAELDREQASWQNRISAYQAARARQGGGAAAEQQLRDSLFTAQEQKRLGAYE